MRFVRSLIALALVSGLATTGCFKHSYTMGAGGNTNGSPKYEKWHAHYFFGMIGEKEVAARDVCPSGNATVKDEVSFVNGLIGSLVGIIYYPSTVEVYCDDGRSASVTVSPETMRSLAEDPATETVIASVDPAKARELAAARTQRAARTHAAR